MSTTTVLVRTLLLSNLVACMAPDDTPAEPTEMEPVSTFTSRTGTTIELYALRSGYSAIEHGDASLPAALGANDVATMTPEELFRHASGTTDIPGEITAMVANHGPLGSLQHLPAVVPTAALSGCSSSAFTAAGNCPFGDYSWCLLNWWNGAYEHLGDVWYTSGNLCVKSGSVLWQIQNGEGGFHQLTVTAGQYYNYYFNDGLDSSWVYYDVLKASGDEFQFGGFGWDG